MARKMNIPQGVAEGKELMQKEMSVSRVDSNFDQQMEELKIVSDACNIHQHTVQRDMKDVKFTTIKKIFSDYGKCLILCDDILNSPNLPSDAEEQIQNMAVDAEKSYNEAVQKYSQLSIEDKLKGIDKNVDDVTVDNLQEIINAFNALTFFSQEQKNIIIKQIENLSDKIARAYDEMLEKSYSDLVFGIAITWLFLYGVYWLLGNVLWGVIPILMVGGYILMCYNKYQQYESVSKRRGESVPFKVLLGILAGNT